MFQQAGRPGWIEVIAGVMFSGKSEELIRRVRRAVIAKKQVQVFKSHLDARYAGLFSISSHDGVTVEAEPVDSAEEISRRLRRDRKSTRLNSSHRTISYAVFCLKKKKIKRDNMATVPNSDGKTTLAHPHPSIA